MTTSQSPIDLFIEGMRIGFKPEADQAVRTALNDSDPARLQAFNDALRSQLSKPTADTGKVLLNALRSTEGPERVANVAFARQIKAAFQAIDVSPNDFSLTPGIPAGQRGLIAQIVHRKDFDISQAIDGYIDPAGSVAIPRTPNSQRRQFDKSQLLKTAQRVFMGAASAEEIREAQGELKAEGFNLGTFGQNHDGVDGVAGKFTVAAITRAIKPPRL